MRTEILKEKIKVFSDAICKYEQTVSELETNIANAKREVSQTAEQMITNVPLPRPIFGVGRDRAA